MAPVVEPPVGGMLVPVLPVVDRRRRSVGMIHLHDLVSKGLVAASSSDF